ncbi:DUF5663 domain-containing protein [Mycolicibacterium vanbaalenii]|uniref:DUF5663 domain-containing protein n=1 Tax=Mycolicibacterium vanbaalenii TaxID=110539 RepID=UPI0021F32292|nr:DUF5663 domain-containing protein [Mycolicibacterium vanbaalenii]
MPDNDTNANSGDRGIRWDVETQLAAILPGLSDEDLTDLASRVGEELHLRIGTALSAGLTNQQLEDFEKLMDGGDDHLRNEWMETHRPDCRATVATVLATWSPKWCAPLQLPIRMQHRETGLLRSCAVPR